MVRLYQTILCGPVFKTLFFTSVDLKSTLEFGCKNHAIRPLLCISSAFYKSPTTVESCSLSQLRLLVQVILLTIKKNKNKMIIIITISEISLAFVFFGRHRVNFYFVLSYSFLAACETSVRYNFQKKKNKGIKN